MQNHSAVIFPGQGAYFPGALTELRNSYPQVNRVFAEIDAALEVELNRPVSAEILDPAAPGIDEWLRRSPDVLQLAIYGVSVATQQILAAHGLKPTVLIGHSLGEIAALVSAGAFTVAEGAQIVWHRSAALRESATDDGYMAAIELDAARTEHLLRLVGDDHAVVAVENHPSQTVVSGPAAALDVAARLAADVRVGFTRLKAAYPFHSPMLAAAAANFAERIADIPQKPMTVPVFSPILGRRYRDDDHLVAELATHFLRPVRFADAIRTVANDGVTVFVESGALHSLTAIVRRILVDSHPVAVAPLRPEPTETIALATALSELNEAGVLPTVDLADRLRSVLLPDVAPADFADFWAHHGADISAYARQEYLNAQASAEVVEAASLITLGAATTPTAANGTDTDGRSRSEVMQFLVQTYAEALEYPVDVFAEDTDLEAELGVDSVKQTELLARISDHYGLPPRPSDFRFADHNTLGRIADLVTGSDPIAAAEPAGGSRSAVLQFLVQTYAEALEYPVDVFAEDTDLEAELGVDSVKQTELLARISDHYGLPPRPSDFRFADHNTLGRIADLVLTTSGSNR
ncbi:MAG TPA: acyltransferase domain-containing protein [Propionibacteriaceae bacterium]|nr:acyltransferase domain-containing protein [Propionibacteriaceae bacterium]